MGKKSKKKTGSKQAHKEKLQERRERVIENLELEQKANEEYEKRRRYDSMVLLYDRVWYKDNGISRRGTVEEITEQDTCNQRQYKILPIDADPEDLDRCLFVHGENVVKDPFDWEPRFKIGDRVGCYTQLEEGDLVDCSYWAPATVTGLYTQSTGLIPNLYQCKLEESCSMSIPGKFYDFAINEDTDDYIQLRPERFRFSEGEEVLFNTNLAIDIRYNPNRDPWIRGTISKVEYFGNPDDEFMKDYAAYVCTFKEKSKTEYCLVLLDNDEYITHVNTGPRERLFNAIENDCSYDHIDYLVESTGIDFASFKDLLISKAIEFGSYETLLWLQEKASVILNNILDSEGNSFLQQIVKGKQAIRFFEKAAKFSDEEREKHISFAPFNTLRRMDEVDASHINEAGESVLHAIFCRKQHNTTLRSLALSDRCCRALFLYRVDLPLFPDPASLESTIDKKIVYDYRRQRKLFQLYSRLHIFTVHDNEDINSLDSLLEGFNERERDWSLAKRYIRFTIARDNGDHYLYRTIGDLVGMGRKDLLMWLVEDNPEFLSGHSYKRRCCVDHFEFAQREITDFGDEDILYQELNLVQLTAHGTSTIYPSSYYYSSAILRYSSIIRRCMMSVIYDSPGEVIDFLKARVEAKIRPGEYEDELLKYKIWLLEDDEYLPRRVEILNYLINEQGHAPPNVVDVVRWRQCGILRWLVERGTIDLNKKAHSEAQILARKSIINFPGPQWLPKTMTVGEFLVLAVIEFDDLQTMCWLVEEQQIQLENIVCNGWNVLHTSAYFGRSEISLSILRQKDMRNFFLSSLSKRRNWESYIALHIAIERGFTNLGDILLALGCPMEDAKGRSVVKLAKRSSRDYVVQWGKEKEIPYLLQKDTNKLRQLLLEMKGNDDLSLVKRFVEEKGCFDMKRWQDAGCSYFDEEGPIGRSYLDVLKECCRIESRSLTVWLCKSLFSRELHGSFNDFWKLHSYPRDGTLALSCIQFAKEADDQKLLVIIKTSPWAKDIRCCDPMDQYPILKELQESLSEFPDVAQDLLEARKGILRRSFLVALFDEGGRYFRKQCNRGESFEAIKTSIDAIRYTASELRKCGFPDSKLDIVMAANGKININCSMLFYGKQNPSPLRWQMKWHHQSCFETHLFYLETAAEGFDELCLWSLESGEGWDAQKEIDVARIVAYRGHSKLIAAFLGRQKHRSINFHSSKVERLYAAALGAAESGRIEDFESYVEEIRAQNFSFNPILKLPKLDTPHADYDDHFYDFRRSWDLLSTSLVCVVVYACVLPTKDPKAYTFEFKSLKSIATKLDLSPETFLHSLAAVLDIVYDVELFRRGISLFDFLCCDMPLNPWLCNDLIRNLTESYFSLATTGGKEELRMKSSEVFFAWLATLSRYGLEFQTLNTERVGCDDRLKKEIQEAQFRQRQQWSNVDILKQGGSLQEIQRCVSEGTIVHSWYDEQGLRLIHLAAAYNRADVLKWLIEQKHSSLNDLDAYGRTVLQVAEASGSTHCSLWIKTRNAAERINRSVASWYHCKLHVRRLKASIRAIVVLQCRVRAATARKLHRAQLLTRVGESLRFKSLWQEVIKSLCKNTEKMIAEPSTWASFKLEKYDMGVNTDSIPDSDLFDTAAVLGEAGKRVLVEPDDPAELEENHQASADGPEHRLLPVLDNKKNVDYVDFSHILLTKEVIKWLRIGDRKYREFFTRRMAQLASGDRSRILAKRLTGSKITIYETYLEQKSGYRILWTERPHHGLLIWYVTKHKAVSRLMGLIDDAENRSNRQLISAAEIGDGDVKKSLETLEEVENDFIMLDPRGDTPLKLYNVPSNEIDRLVETNWEPRLHLTDSEKDIVEIEGTVLVLGRSGTGKTVCICNRMEYDFQIASNSNVSFSQLFVARSTRLCKYVENAVKGSTRNEEVPGRKRSFTTFKRLIQSLERVTPACHREGAKHFLPSQYIDFHRFKRDLWKPNMGVDALIAWASIRSFIKGSIDAVQKRKHLDKDAYFSLGKKRCRLTMAQRKAVYDVYLKYEKYREELGLWDDCDRVQSLLVGLKELEQTDSLSFYQMQYNKIYVDEVQDYTQAEIALFFCLCGPGGLFLAGDPAQSVVEGVEFRFEEVRSVGHCLYNQDKKLIPDKPKTVNVNFRSHSGILNVAAGVLGQLFKAFPDAAKQLKKDRGLFLGPRPSVLHKVELHIVRDLIAKLDGLVILTHDNAMENLKQQLDYPLVYGIREAKGLEFQSVLLLDFFCRLPTVIQKPFRDLLLGRRIDDLNSTCPEMEGYLKLLYTGITRCIQRLVFAETKRSIAGDAFVRWITTTKDERGRRDSLAVHQGVDDLEVMSRTPDEWRASGLEHAIVAENATDAGQTLSWLEKAIFAFEKAGDKDLSRKARVHKVSALLRGEIDRQRVLKEEKLDVVVQLEVEVAQAVTNLLATGLLFEAKYILEAMLPLLAEYTREKLQTEVILRFPSMEQGKNEEID